MPSTEEYPHYVSIYPATASGGSYNASRVFTPGTAPDAVWEGFVDIQDSGRTLDKLRTGDESKDFDAVVFFAEVDEIAALSTVAVGMNIDTPFGLGRIVRVVHIDGHLEVKYVRG
jgi:hypothetical protein